MLPRRLLAVALSYLMGSVGQQLSMVEIIARALGGAIK